VDRDLFAGPGLAADRATATGGTVAFFLGLLLFVVVVGFADAKLRWPPPTDRRNRR
jgi:hypothetical protein